MDDLLDRLRAVRHHQSSDYDSGPRQKWTVPKNPDGEEAALRIEALEGLVERARLLIDPCYPKEHGDWQKHACATLNTKGQ